MTFESAIELALRNIAEFGDTDVFPRPFENYMFFDNPAECRARLLDVHNNLDLYLASQPPSTIVTLTQVGYTGFRWATQIEPFWNAYYLALVISLAEQIESSRIPVDAKTVFSYRYLRDANSAKLFSDSSWRDYKLRSLELSRENEFVVVTDVADFYPRVYHHRIENSLLRLPGAGDLPKRIMQLLSQFSNNVSYGLPIGGPASRILAELALSPVDKHLFSRRISFCRYADDFSLFCKTKADAYNFLVLLSEKLFNEGLILQKAKTRILSAREFQEISEFLDPKMNDDSNVTDEQKLLNIPIRYDPYSSETPNEDYEILKAAVQEVDILGILGREVGKTAIDPTISKQAINAIRAIDASSRSGAIKMLLESTNLEILSPVFVSVMRMIRGIYCELDEDDKTFVDKALVNVYDTQPHLLSVSLNLSYFLQALSLRHSDRKEEILVELFDENGNALIRRQIILAMAHWRCFYWLTDIRKRYSSLSDWEKRAFILASYVLGDEGRHWRDHTKHTWNHMDRLVRGWMAIRWQKIQDVPL